MSNDTVIDNTAVTKRRGRKPINRSPEEQAAFNEDQRAKRRERLAKKRAEAKALKPAKPKINPEDVPPKRKLGRVSPYKTEEERKAARAAYSKAYRAAHREKYAESARNSRLRKQAAAQ